jgi:hypothetical protein
MGFECLLCGNEMGNSRANLSRKLAPICPNPLWDLFADAVLKFAYYRGMNPLEWFPHFGFPLLPET